MAQSCPALCHPMACSSPPGSLSMGFSRQEYWSGFPFPSPGDLLDSDWSWVSCMAGRFFTIWATGETLISAKEENKEGEDGAWDGVLGRAARDHTSTPALESVGRRSGAVLQEGSLFGKLGCCCSAAKSWSHFAPPWAAAHQASLSFTISQSLLRLMSIESVMPSNHLILSSSSPPAFNLSQHRVLFQWVGSSHQMAEVLELQLQHQSF